MSVGEAFFDSNVLLYMLMETGEKAQRSEELLQAGGVISVQVLNEFAHVARRKKRSEWREIKAVLEHMRESLRVVPLTETTHDFGMDLVERYSLSLYDSMIVAAAHLAGCKTLYSEDMQDGLAIGELTIRNPYL